MSLPDDASDDRATRTYTLVIVTEAVVIAALWVMQRIFS